MKNVAEVGTKFILKKGFPQWLSGKESAYNARVAGLTPLYGSIYVYRVSLVAHC